MNLLGEIETKTYKNSNYVALVKDTKSEESLVMFRYKEDLQYNIDVFDDAFFKEYADKIRTLLEKMRKYNSIIAERKEAKI